MKRIVLFILALELFIFPTISVFGGGFESPGLGARATSMGGAFIGLADDWTAIYWNPAGLTQLQRAGIGLSLEYLSARAHDSSGLLNPPAPLAPSDILRWTALVQLGGEPLQFNALDSSSNVPLPAVGFYVPWHGLTFAGGSFVPLGFSSDVRDSSVPGFDVSFKSRAYMINHNLSVAGRLNDRVSLGAGVNLVQGHLERFANKKAPTEELSSSAKVNGLGVQGVFGLLVKLSSRWQLGGVYRTGQNLPLKGDSCVSDTLFPLPTPMGTLQNETSSLTQTVRNPTTYGIGLAWKASPQLTLTADWQRTQWRSYRLDVHFDQPEVLLQNQYLDPEWQSTSRYRFGLEWNPSSNWTLNAGYFRDPRAVSFASQSLTNLVDVDTRYYTGGLSFRPAPQWQVTLGEQYASGREVLGARVLRKEATSTSLQVEFGF